jgi:hypothetical protein
MEASQELQRKSSKSSAYELKKLFNSKEKSHSKDPKDYYPNYNHKDQHKERDSYSKKKRSVERTYVNNLNKTHKTLSGKLAATNLRPNKFEKTTANPLRA